MLVTARVFPLHSALIPFIGGEFCPTSMKAPIWVRATMPYTISFEEAARFAPKVRRR